MLLALDISTVQTGYAVGPRNGKPRYGVWRPPSHFPRHERIAYMAASVLQLAKAMKVTEVAAEQLSVTGYKRADGSKADGNFKSAEALAECRGVIKHELRVLHLRQPMLDVNLSSARARLGIMDSLGLPGGCRKEHVLTWLRNHGIPVANGDEADALVVWLARTLGRV